MSRRGAVLALWATCLIWGITFPLVKLALADASPMAFTAARFLLAALIISPALPRATAGEWRAGVVLGCLLMTGFGVQTVGIQFTTPSRSGFITSLYIPFTPLVVLAAYRVLPDRLAGLGLGVAIGGMILLTRPEGGMGGLNAGDLLTLVCAAAFAVHLVATGHFARRYAPERLMVTQIAVAAVISSLLAVLVETPRFRPTPFLIGFTIYEAVLASVVAIRLQLAAQRVLPANYTALVYTLEPLIAAGASLALTGDRLGPIQWLGGALILAGSLLPEFRQPREVPSGG
jgi:drug/metabolite transporter (DMT)-like permease